MTFDGTDHLSSAPASEVAEVSRRVSSYLRGHRINPAQIPLLTQAIMAEAQCLGGADTGLLPRAIDAARARVARNGPGMGPRPMLAPGTPPIRVTHMGPPVDPNVAPGERPAARPRRSWWTRVVTTAAILTGSYKPTRAPSR